MRILIEEYQYPADSVKNILDGISTLRDVKDKVSVNYVGYYYNPSLKDCVFILPKVLIDANEMVFGHCKPEDIIHLESSGNLLSQEERDFIYELAVWIYRAIVVFNDTVENTIVRRQYVSQMSKGRLRQSNTFLDILLALQKFNRDNQQFFFFILKNIHSGFNKINWNKTISKNDAIVQNGTPIYTQVVNKKRQINFDEELLIIFFSILNYMHEEYGFPVQITLGFELIKGNKFRQYMNGLGLVRLHQIKYKYFSDKALYLWELCYAFFDQSKKINVETTEQEYLLVTNFNIVFESIIDELIGDSRDKIPPGLKDQEDGKRVDHLFRYKNLTNDDREDSVYYIGDSKYYKQKTPLGAESVYKQFTYARNLIQWNLDLFNNSGDAQGLLKLRDDVTEGYNVVPNFFISAQQNDLKQVDDISSAKVEPYVNKQFENRLFDRDTLIVAHYNVNFLFIIALYGRNNPAQKDGWKNKVREMFRKEIRKVLEDKFQFYVMTAHADVIADEYLRENFQMVLGKVFTPFKDKDYYSVALDRDEKFREENEALLDLLKQNFEVKECSIGVDPSSVLEKIPRKLHVAPAARFLTQHWLENYMDANIVVGCYKSQEHLDWILGNNDKGTKLYNVRLDKNRAGAQLITQTRERKVSFVVLYDIEDVAKEPRVFRVHHTAVMDEARMVKAKYPNPQGRYFCYVFDEEVSLGKLDIAKFIEERSTKEDYIKGAPIYVKGAEMIKYRG